MIFSVLKQPPKKPKNVTFNAIYRPPNGYINLFENFCKDVFLNGTMVGQIWFVLEIFV